jgi:hypothetical protein
VETSRDLVKGNPGETQAVLIQVSFRSIKYLVAAAGVRDFLVDPNPVYISLRIR